MFKTKANQKIRFRLILITLVAILAAVTILLPWLNRTITANAIKQPQF